jgi:hypothetical protein
MGQKAADFLNKMTAALKAAENEVKGLSVIEVKILQGRSKMEQAFAGIANKMKMAANKTFAEVARNDAALQQLAKVFYLAEKDVDACKATFARQAHDASEKIAAAADQIKQFQAYCNARANSWNPLKKRNLAKSLAALQKAEQCLQIYKNLLVGLAAQKL